MVSPWGTGHLWLTLPLYADVHYLDVCITPPPPILHCDDISNKSFRVLPPDPHGFDSDEDSIGCEPEPEP